MLKKEITETKGVRRSYLKCFRADTSCCGWRLSAYFDRQGHAGEGRSRAEAVYVNLTDRPIRDSEEVVDSIVVDYDAEGRIIGIEILDASKRIEDPSALKQFSFANHWMFGGRRSAIEAHAKCKRVGKA